MDSSADLPQPRLELASAHTLDFAARQKKLAACATVFLVIGLIISAPRLGWLPVLVAAALIPLSIVADLAGRRLDIGALDWYVIVPWLTSSVMFGAIIALTGGPRSPCAGFLIMSTVLTIGAFPRNRLAIVCSVSVAIWLAACLLSGASVGLASLEFAAPPTAALLACGLVASGMSSQATEQRRRAIIDPLTGVFNRTSLPERVQEMLITGARAGASVSVVVCDIDYFKEINDEFGHSAGDLALQAIGYALRAGVRTFDPVFRIGGEEFAILVPGAVPEDAAVIAESLRRKIEELRPGDIAVTMSFGIAGGAAHRGTFEGLFGHADAALYEAKRAGRNRVVISSASSSAHPTAIQAPNADLPDPDRASTPGSARSLVS